jgi:hypothetical protein
MKAKHSTSKPARREIFVLTPEEKKTVCFVLVAFVLGLATKYYRDAHPRLLPNPDISVPGHASPDSRREMRTPRRPKL